MILGVPATLIVVYALYRMNEYYMIRHLQAVHTAPPSFVHPNRHLLFSAFILTARVFGWVFLLYFGFRYGWMKPVVLILIAFPLSLILQWAPVLLLRPRLEPVQIDQAMTRIGFAAVPTCAILMFVLLPPL